MQKNLELSRPDSCFNKAEDDEFVFVLRANDPIAPQTIRHWCTMAVGLHEPEKIAAARRIASAMEEWKKNKNAPVCAPEKST